MHEREVLKKWKAKSGFRARYRRLVEAYLELEERGAAEAICKEIGKFETKPPTPQVGIISRGGAQAQAPPNMFMQRLCCSDEPVESVDLPGDVAKGSIRPSKLWRGYKDRPLKVFFLNPKVLKSDSWTFDNNILTTSTILAWATYWNSHADHYPRIAITEATSKNEAEIRVKFNPRSNISNWSKVGADAATVAKDKHTMALNLNVNGMRDQDKRSMVLHEFGHALGLDHEHQRSDFWEVLEAKDQQGSCKFIIGRELMLKNGACLQHFKETATFECHIRSAYDPTSIMHYWFSVQWLLPRYWSLKEVREDPHLSPEEKSVLEGVHTRHFSNGQLAGDPSKEDYKVLNDAYKNPAGAINPVDSEV